MGRVCAPASLYSEWSYHPRKWASSRLASEKRELPPRGTGRRTGGPSARAGPSPTACRSPGNPEKHSPRPNLSAARRPADATASGDLFLGGRAAAIKWGTTRFVLNAQVALLPASSGDFVLRALWVCAGADRADRPGGTPEMPGGRPDPVRSDRPLLAAGQSSPPDYPFAGGTAKADC